MQFLIRNRNQRIDMFDEFRQTFIGYFRATLEFERLGYHSDGQNTKFFGYFSNYGCCTGTRATAHTGSDKYHVSTAQQLCQSLPIFYRCGASCFRIGTRP